MENQNQEDNGAISLHKNLFIHFTSRLLEFQTPRPLLALLLLLQSLQFISMGLVAPISYHSIGIAEFRTLANFIYPEAFLRRTRCIQYLVPILFSITITHSIVLARAFYKFKQNSESRLALPVHCLFCLTIVIFSPSFLINLATLVCSSSSPYHQSRTCYSGYHILLSLMSIVNIIWLFFVVTYQVMFYMSRNPFLPSYYSCSSNLWMLGKFVAKIGPAIFLVMDVNLNFKVLYIVSLTAFNAGYLAVFRFMWPYFRTSQFIEKIVLRFEALVVCVTASFMPLFFLSPTTPSNAVFYSSWVVGVLGGECLVRAYLGRKDKLRNSLILGKFEKDELDQYIQFFYYLIENIQLTLAVHQSPVLLDLALSHSLRCQLPDCACKPLLLNLTKVQAGLTSQQIYQFILCLVREVEQSTKKSPTLTVLWGYICYYRLGFKACSVFKLAHRQDDKTEFVDVVGIQQLIHHYKKTNSEQTQMIKYREFSEQLWEFERLVLQAAHKCVIYWRELVQQDNEVTKIWKIAHLIHQDKAKVEDFLRTRLLTIFPNNLYAKRIFLEMFLCVYRVPVAEVRALLIQFEETSRQEEEMIDFGARITFRQNSDITVFCATQAEGSFAFSNISSNVSELLGKKNSSLKGKPISCLLPDSMKKMHDEKLSGYLSKSDEEVQPREAAVIVMNDQGNFVQCAYEVKIFPNLESGIELVCFMKRIPTQRQCYYIIYQSYECSDEHSIPIDRAVSGTVDEIDDYLKRLMFIQDEDNANIPLSQILPEWDISQEVFTERKGVHNQNSVSFVQLIDTIRIDPSLHLKVLRVYIDEEKEQNYDDFQAGTQGSVHSMRSNTSLCHLASPAESPEEQSRLELLGLKDVMHEQSSEFKAKFDAINSRTLAILFIVMLSLPLLCSLLALLVGQGIEERVSTDLAAIESLTVSSLSITWVAIETTKIERFPTAETNIVYYLTQMSSNIASVYAMLDLVTINEFIKLTLSFIQQDGSEKRQKRTLDESISQYKVSALQYFKTRSPKEATFVKQSWILIADALGEIVTLSHRVYLKAHRRSSLFLYCLNSVNLIFVIVSSIAIFIRLDKVFIKIGEVVQGYEQKVETEVIKSYESECEDFMQRVSNRRKQEKSRLGFGQGLSFLDQFEMRTVYCEEEEEQLIKLKNRILFQKIPTNRSYIAIIVVSCVLFISLSCLLLSEWDHRFHRQEHQTRRSFVASGLKLERGILKMLYYQYAGEKQPFQLAVQQIETLLYQLNSNKLSHPQFSFEEAVQSFSQIYHQDFTTIDFEYIKAQSQLFLVRLRAAILLIARGFKVTSLKLFLVESAMKILWVVVLWKLVVAPVEAMAAGSCMMKQMLRTYRMKEEE